MMLSTLQFRPTFNSFPAARPGFPQSAPLRQSAPVLANFAPQAPLLQAFTQLLQAWQKMAGPGACQAPHPSAPVSHHPSHAHGHAPPALTKTETVFSKLQTFGGSAQTEAKSFTTPGGTRVIARRDGTIDLYQPSHTAEGTAPVFDHFRVDQEGVHQPDGTVVPGRPTIQLEDGTQLRTIVYSGNETDVTRIDLVPPSLLPDPNFSGLIEFNGRFQPTSVPQFAFD